MISDQEQEQGILQGGFALLAVLLFLMVVAAAVTPFVLAARTDLLLARGAHEKERMTILAEGLLEIVARRIADTRSAEANAALLLNSSPMRSVCGNIRAEISAQDQLGVVDLNAAGPDLLAAGFEALGFDRGKSRRLAELAVSYRTPPGTEIESAGEQQLSDGFKRGPFEAIEELYEFPDFQGMPAGFIGQAFTVYGRRPTINANNMSAPLSKVLPSGPSARYPFIIAGEDESGEPGKFYRIGISVRSAPSANAGFAGWIVEIAGDEQGSYRIVDTVSDPAATGAKDNPFAPNADCVALFGEAPAALIARY